jgi:GT2 family glycosyltransferase
MSAPNVSVIIPNWNGVSHLPVCLDALRRQSYTDFQAIVVDNASTDGSLQLLKSYPEVEVIEQQTNLFFSGAVNDGICRTQSPIIVLLNNDTEPEPSWLAELVSALEAHPEAGFAASKLLIFDERDVIHSAGDGYGLDGIPRNRGVWTKDKGQFDKDTYVFSACAGAAAYRRELFDDIGLFDEDFVGYCEDVDLAFRAQLAGYRCVFAPKARVYHKISATGSGPLASYLCGRNFINVVIKDMPGELLRRHWPKIIKGQLGYVGQSLRHIREPAARARVRGQVSAIGQLPKMISKRRCIQARRRVSTSYIEEMLSEKEA